MTFDRRQLRGLTAFYALGLLAQGGLTLLARQVPAVDRAAPAILARTRMVPPHSLLHIVTGLLALGTLLWGSAAGSWRFLLGFGIGYSALGLAGALTGERFGLELQPFDHPIHLAIGGLALVGAWLGRGAA